jgi:hypothetical protein
MDLKSSPFLARTHRKRSSLTKLSSDTTATLPAYLCTEQLPDDNPPDYPESPNEAADADSESDHITPDMLPPARTSPRSRRVHSHGRRHTVSPIIPSSTDPYLDSLLARSVHALEMSNALLQSSISTHSSLSAALAVDSPIVESSLEARARVLSSRIRVNSGVHANWLDDLATISEHVTTDAQPDALGLSLAHNDIVSWSLPVDPSPLRLRTHHHRNHSSSDLRLTAETSNPDRPHLSFSNWPRSRLISPAPRALTQYVESNADPDTIQLPSTIGIHSSPSTHFPPGVSSPSPTKPPSPTASRSTLAESSTTAYTLLCSVLDRRPSTSSTASHVSIHSRSECRAKARRSSADSTTSPSRASTVIPSRKRTPHSSPSCSRVGKRSLSPQPIPPSPAPPARLLTPPTENPSLSSLSSTSSSNPSSDPHPNPILSVQALRKILDDQQHSQNMSCAQLEARVSHRPTFLPRSPLPPPTLGTSTATASVSRLFTKPVHMHSGSSSREPRPSALKSGLRTPQSPPPSSTPNGFLEPGRGVGTAGGSSASSARSTPKRISFAELPEPYGSERGGAGSGRGFEKTRSRRTTKKRSGGGKGKGKDKIKGKGKARVNRVDDESEGSDRDDEEDEEEDRGWWVRLLLGSGSTRSLSLGRTEDRIESRIARGLGNRGGFGGGMEDWAV